MVFKEILIQAGAYAIVLVMAISFSGLLLKGFFWKYIKVRLSFGRLVLIKVRGKLTDFFAVGKVEEGHLIFKIGKNKKRISLKDKNSVYRSLSVNWIDLDEEKNSICNADYSTSEGFDAKKFEDLYERALFQPQIGLGGKEKIIIFLVVVAIVAAGGALYMSYSNAEILQTLGPQITEQVSRLAQAAQGTVVGSSSTI